MDSWSCVRNHGPHDGWARCDAHMAYEAWSGGQRVAQIDAAYYDMLPREYQREFNLRSFDAMIRIRDASRNFR